jgi:hypothetical protein
MEGGLAAPPPKDAAPHETGASCATCPPAIAEEAEVIADPEVRERFVRTAGRYLARTGGRR